MPFASELMPRAATACLGLSPARGGGRRKGYPSPPIHEDLKGQNQGEFRVHVPGGTGTSAVGFSGRAGTQVKKEAGEGRKRGGWAWGGLSLPGSPHDGPRDRSINASRVGVTSEHCRVPEVLKGTTQYPGSSLEGNPPHLPGEKGRSRLPALP